MPAANIEINGVATSDDDLPINVIVQLSNLDTGGEVTYLWEILDQPEAIINDSLSSAVIENPTFTPRKEGSYLIRLTVNQGTGTQVINTKIAAVRQLKTNERVPSAFEIFEVDTAKGWKTAANRQLARLDDGLADSNLIVAVDFNSSPPVIGDIVAFTRVLEIKTGLPGVETLPVVQRALGTNASHMRSSTLGIVIRTPSGGSTGPDALVVVRTLGLVELGVTTGATPVVGDFVWVGDDNRPSLTPGTNGRVIGKVADFVTGTYRFFIDGSSIILSRTENLAAVGHGIVLSGWAMNLVDCVWVSSAAGDFVVGLEPRVGDTLVSYTFSLFGDGAADLTATINRITAAGVASVVDATTVTNPPAAWADTTISGLTGPVLAGQGLFIRFTSSAANLRIGTIRPTFVPSP